MAVYETLEYMFCYDDEKKKHQEDMRTLAEQRRRGDGQAGNTEGATSQAPTPREDTGQSHSDDTSEVTRLLSAQEIPLESISPSENRVNNGTVLPCPNPSQDSVKNEGIAKKVKHIVSRFFRRRSHQYAALSEKALLADEDADDVIFDVSDRNCTAETTAEPDKGCVDYRPRDSTYIQGESSVISQNGLDPKIIQRDNMAETEFISGNNDVTGPRSLVGSPQGGATFVEVNGSAKPVSADLVVLNPTG